MDENTAEVSTRLLRTSDDPLFVRLRQLLVERSIDPETAILADFFPDDTDLEFGVLVTADRRVFEFDLRYGKGDLKAQARTAVITDWRDRTDWWEDTPSRVQVRQAMLILDAQGSA